MSATVIQFPCTRQKRPAAAKGAKPSPAQLSWLRTGFRRPSGALSQCDDQARWVRPATVRACLARGWVVERIRFKVGQVLDEEIVVYRLTLAGIDAVPPDQRD